MEEFVSENSIIFKDPTLIDCIRQICIDYDGKDYTKGNIKIGHEITEEEEEEANDEIDDGIDDEIDDESAQIFLEQAQKYFEKDIDYQTFKELFSAISSCILHKQVKPDAFFNHFLAKKEFNDIDIMILTNFYIYFKEKIPNSKIKTLYLTIKDKLRPIIFDKYLTKNNQSKFQNELMFNALLISNNKNDKEIITKYLPTFLINNLFSSNPKFNDLLFNQKKDFQILPQTDSSFNEILEFITKKDINLLFKMSTQASSLIIASILTLRIFFPRFIQLLDEKTVFPFIAVSHILKKYIPKARKIHLPNFLISKAINCQFDNPCYIKSIDYILSHKKILNEFDNEQIKIIFKSLHKQLDSNKYQGDVLILLKAMFDKDYYYQFNIKYFLEMNKLKDQKSIISIINKNSTHLNGFNEEGLSSKKEFIDLIDFISRCSKRFLFEFDNDYVLDILKEEIDNKNWENVSLIGKYAMKTPLSTRIEKIVHFINIPIVIKRIFNNNRPYNNDIDELIMNLLCDTQPEVNIKLHSTFLNKMLEDEEIRDSYYGYLISTNLECSIKVDVFLKKYLREFREDPNNFISAVNKQYVYNAKNKILRKKMDFKISSLPVSKFGVSIVNKFLTSIKEKPNNFQAFVALKNISYMYPFLFNVNTQEIFEIVFANLDSITLIFEKFESKEQSNQIKTAYSAISFLLYTFQSPIVLDKFMEWSLKNIASFSNAQVLCFFLLIRAMCYHDLFKWFAIIWFKRFDFLNTMADLIDRDIQNKCFRTFYREMILSIVSGILSFMKQKQNKFNFIQIMELSKIEYPFAFFFDTFILGIFGIPYKISMPKLSQRISLFVKYLDSVPYYCLSRRFHLEYEDEDEEDPFTEDILLSNCYIVDEEDDLFEEEEEEFNEEEESFDNEENNDDESDYDIDFHVDDDHFIIFDDLDDDLDNDFDDSIINDNIYDRNKWSFTTDKLDYFYINPKTQDKNNFTQKLTDSNIQTSELPNLPKIPEYFTVKMARYLLSKPCFIYLYVLYQYNIPLDVKLHQAIFDTINKLNEMFEQAGSDDEENSNIKDFDCTKEIISQTSLQRLIQKLISSQLFNNRNKKLIKFLGKTLVSICENNECYYIIQFICESFKDIYLKNQENMNYITVNSLHRLVDILKTFSKSNLIKEKFFDFGGNLLLDTIMAPDLRRDESLLLKFASFLNSFQNNLSIKTTHLICFLSILNKEQMIKMALKLCSKFSYEDLENIDQVLIKILDKELQKNSLTSILKIFFKSCPSVLQQRRVELIDLLKECLKDMHNIQTIGLIFTALAPQRNVSTSITRVIVKPENIPSKIFDTSPQFWTLFSKYKKKLIDKIDMEPSLLNYYKFLLDYPELISFETRSKYFRNIIRKRIHKELLRPFRIDRKEILKSSFKEFKSLSSEDNFLKHIEINFIGEKGVDGGGLKREWFTLLIEEIFDKETGLFNFSVENSCYKLNPKSTNYEYIRFAGIVIARALIDGQTINANLSIPTWKDILHRPLKLNDLESANKDLYTSLNWIENNNVDPLDMYFVYSTVNNETIPLKPNGDNIKLTNENKKEFIRLYYKYELELSIEKQKKSFVEGFDSLIPHEEIRIFTPNELNLLVCGIPKFDVEDFRKNIHYEYPLNSNSPVVKFFFSAISKWNDEKLAKLLFFMTGCSRVPANGFKEFYKITGSYLRIQSGGTRSQLPSAVTCANTISLPDYKSEKELNEKLLKAIEYCNTFENI